MLAALSNHAARGARRLQGLVIMLGQKFVLDQHLLVPLSNSVMLATPHAAAQRATSKCTTCSQRTLELKKPQSWRL